MEFTMIEAGWLSIVPPILAIALALLTKEVYSSLFIGILSGMLIYAFLGGGTVFSAASMTFDMMSSKIADNAYMIIFLALLWAVVSLVSKSGGSQAYGRWAGRRLNSKRSAAFATSLLGILIFIDDGFNCLTVGTVMRPITDRLRISREKLAYIIDATAAPVCIIAPVSSWAVAVASEVSQENGFHAFLSTIPYNFYALMTILMVFFISFTGRDFGPMKKAEAAAREQAAREEAKQAEDKQKGHVLDLVLPILVLIICAILGMAYVGGFFEGVSFSEAIGYNPTAGLSLGAFAGLLTALLLYLAQLLLTRGNPGRADVQEAAMRVGRAAARIRNELQVPQYALAVDVLSFPSPAEPQLAALKQMELFRRGDSLCLFDGLQVFALPLSGAALRVEQTSLAVERAGWSKSLPPTHKQYRSGGVSAKGKGPLTLRFCCALETQRVPAPALPES